MDLLKAIMRKRGGQCTFDACSPQKNENSFQNGGFGKRGRAWRLNKLAQVPERFIEAFDLLKSYLLGLRKDLEASVVDTIE